jgi:predicted transposase/invertase (TIGR01784 family)
VNEQDAIDTALNKGLQQGELNTKKAIAKKMLESGMDIETIVAMTGLSPNEIKEQ